MLELSILGFLYEENLNGYELKKRIAHLTGYYSKISDGSLYPAIKRLEKKGYLLKKTPASGGSRISYILELTSEGKSEFYRRLQKPTDLQISDRNNYFTILAFLHNLNGEEQQEILKRRLDFISQKKGFFFQKDNPLKENDVDSPFKKGMYEIARATTKAEKNWLLKMIG